MKKLFWLLLILLLIGALYLFIPSNVALRQTRKVSVNAIAFSRLFLSDDSWHEWWPGSVQTSSTQAVTYQLNQTVFRVKEKRYSSLLIEIERGQQRAISELFFIVSDPVSINLTWEGKAATSKNPFQRVARFLAIEPLQRDMATVLERISSYYGNEKNIYQLSIEKSFVPDSSFISTTAFTQGYPAVDTVYQLVDKLQVYALKKGGKQSGPPMLNISRADGGAFKAQVGLPVNKMIPDEGDIRYRWMLRGGNILRAEVKGGPQTINNAFTQMELYIQDNRRTAPAIPFQSLVTDRRQERDTSKWVTRLYWPVM